MKLFYFLLLISIACLNSCKDNTLSFAEECPYDFAITGHFLKVPIEVSPHSMNYSVGDTIIFTSEFSDSIVDVGTQESFLIRDFPFEPVSHLYRFYDDDFNYDAGYTVNTHTIEDKYEPVFKASSERIDWFWAKTIYNGGVYKFDHRLILDKPGRYIMLTTDVYMIREASDNSEVNDSIRAIEFEGKCNRVPMFVVSIVEGNDHMEEFMDELLFLDENVYSGGLASRDQGFTGPLKAGSLRLEFNGLFCFEVTE